MKPWRKTRVKKLIIDTWKCRGKHGFTKGRTGVCFLNVRTSEWILDRCLSLTLWSDHVHELSSSASVEAHDVIVPDDTLTGLSDPIHLHIAYALNNTLRVEECSLGQGNITSFYLVDIVSLWSASLDRAPWLLWTAAHIGKITTTMSCKTD